MRSSAILNIFAENSADREVEPLLDDVVDSDGDIELVVQASSKPEPLFHERLQDCLDDLEEIKAEVPRRYSSATTKIIIYGVLLLGTATTMLVAPGILIKWCLDMVKDENDFNREAHDAVISSEKLDLEDAIREFKAALTHKESLRQQAVPVRAELFQILEPVYHEFLSLDTPSGMNCLGSRTNSTRYELNPESRGWYPGRYFCDFVDWYAGQTDTLTKRCYEIVYEGCKIIGANLDLAQRLNTLEDAEDSLNPTIASLNRTVAMKQHTLDTMQARWPQPVTFFSSINGWLGLLLSGSALMVAGFCAYGFAACYTYRYKPVVRRENELGFCMFDLFESDEFRQLANRAGVDYGIQTSIGDLVARFEEKTREVRLRHERCLAFLSGSAESAKGTDIYTFFRHGAGQSRDIRKMILDKADLLPVRLIQ